MVLFRPVFVAAMIRCLSLVLVCLLFAPDARAVPQYLNRLDVLDAVPNPSSGKGSLGTWPGGEADTNDATVDETVSTSPLSSASATASASAAPSQASSSTNGASGMSVPAAFLFGTAASVVFLTF